MTSSFADRSADRHIASPAVHGGGTIKPVGFSKIPLPLRRAFGLLLAGAAGAAATASTAWGSLEWGVVAVLLAAVASVAAVSASSRNHRVGLFLPYTFIGLWAVSYGLASLAWRNPVAELLTQDAEELVPGSLPFGLAIATVGLLAWTAGYCGLRLLLVRALMSSVRRWSTGDAQRHRNTEYSLGRIVVVYAVGLGARLALLAVGRYSYITTDLQGAITESSPVTAILGHLEYLTTVGLLLLAYTAFTSRTKSATRLLILAVAFEIPFGLLSGLRSFILLRLLGVAVTYVLINRRVPFVATVSLLGLLAVLSPFTTAYRDEVRDASQTTVAAGGAAALIPTLLATTVREVSPGDIVSGPSDFVTSRLRFVDEVAIVGQKTPTVIPFVPALDTLLEATTVLVPRAVWQGKPVYTSGIQYARDFWNQPELILSSRSPTFPGDAYYRGGWPALLILMATVGGVMAAINTALSPQLHPASIPMFVIAWTGLMNLESSLVLLGAGLAQSLLIAAVAMRWASSTRLASNEHYAPRLRTIPLAARQANA